jgi:orotate phosphoribosyltransferase
VDDVITTGDSTIDAIRKAREEGLNVSEVLALVDRQESDGAANIQRQGVRFKTLFNMADLRRMLGAPNVKSAA